METDKFVERAKAGLDQIDTELGVLEARVTACRDAGDQWAANQARKLRADVETAKAEVTAIEDHLKADVTADLDRSKADAERHWAALKAAVKAYREHVG